MEVTRGERHLALHFPELTEAVGSAVFGGGMVRIRTMVNIYVDKFYRCDDPERDIRELLDAWGYPLETTAGLLTAVKMDRASIFEEQDECAGVLCCVTAGVGNGAKAGVRRTTFPADYVPGTINIMLAVNGRLTPAAMVNALMTATEAKAAALADLGIRDPETGGVATGTTTDAVMLAVSQSRAGGPLHKYAGTATDLGGRIGRLVYAAVTESLADRSERT
nr:adenosylcobinamide amidohydrolase [Paenibacillus caui]